VPAARPLPRLRAGQVVVLPIQDAGFQAYISVVCLENGVSGGEIRVRDPVNGKIHHARVTEEGGLQWTGEL